ncbi:hypothetical protein [Paenibacillus agaridevorans]|uniref:hypothetical protein n=1 Tax=Paenibacillus agaridevorans TaxID=171404 RepID=UPI001BE4581E|nr:hypothetical protein [Paenibacillus agaridevorans]
MNKNELHAHFENMTPNERQKARMRANILNSRQPVAHTKVWARLLSARWAIPAICLVLAIAVFLSVPFGEKTTAYAIDVRIGEDGPAFRLADNEKRPGEYGTIVSNVDSRPGLEFYIEGENIAKIEISTQNEYIYAVDWTKTQDEKFWNSELYQTFDEESQISKADFGLLYDKKITMNFDEDFNNHGDIWYRWTAWNMYKWAAEDDYAHFLGANQALPEDLTSQEALAAAAGNDGSGIGHMQLDEYPEELKEDQITIVITDREGKRTKKVIHVKVSNNELRQTVVTASLEE